MSLVGLAISYAGLLLVECAEATHDDYVTSCLQVAFLPYALRVLSCNRWGLCASYSLNKISVFRCSKDIGPGLWYNENIRPWNRMQPQVRDCAHLLYIMPHYDSMRVSFLLDRCFSILADILHSVYIASRVPRRNNFYKDGNWAFQVSTIM
jgi:hypothetical protein